MGVVVFACSPAALSPLDGQRVIALHAVSELVHERQVALCIGVPLLCSLAIPGDTHTEPEKSHAARRRSCAEGH